MVLEDWILLQGDGNWRMPDEMRKHFAWQLALLAEKSSNGHLNGACIEIDDSNNTLSLNDDKSIRDEYAAPEILDGKASAGFSSAAFSVGVLLDEMRRGSTYWSEQKWDAPAFRAAIAEKGDEWLDVPQDDPLRKVIKACTSVHSEDRPWTLDELNALLRESGVPVPEKESENSESRNEEEQEKNHSNTSGDEQTEAKKTEGNDSDESSDDYEETHHNVKESDVAVGIDLGTSYSTVAYYKDGQLHFLEIRRQNSTPSVIFFEDTDKQIFGETALRKGIAYPESLFKHFKRHIGEEKKFPFVCHNKQKKPESFTYIIDTNAFINDPQILDGIDSRHHIIVPKVIYEELNYRLGEDATHYRAKEAIAAIDEKKDIILFENADMGRLPPDFFSYEDHTNNNRNDNRVLAIALAHNDPSTVVITSDRGIHTKAGWLRKEQGAKFQVKTLKEFQYEKSTKFDNPADIQLSGQDGEVLFLKYLRREMEKELGVVTHAVITVPQLFNTFERDKTKEAALAAGFSEVDLETEPVAAAVAYGLDQGEEKNLLIYDFGGGTFDVAIIRRDGDGFHVLGTGGDPRLGGEDFTQMLVDRFMDQLLDDEELDMNDEESSGLSHDEYCKNKEQIWSKCEQLKIDLSESDNEEVSIRVYVQPGSQKDVTFELSRDDFEDITGELVERSRKALEKALKSAGLSRGDIDSVIMAGGTSSIPCLHSFVEQYFGDQTPIMKDRNTATLIAAGAAAFADREWNPDSTIHQKIHIYENTIDDLGVGYKRDSSDLHYRFDALVAAGTGLPCRSQSRDYSLPKDGTKDLTIMFYTRQAGSTAELTTDDGIRYIGKILIKDLPPLRQSESVVRVTFELTKEYLLNVMVNVLDRNENVVKSESVRINKVGV